MKRYALVIFAFLFTFSAFATQWSARKIQRETDLKNVPTINSWDMTCKELGERIDALGIAYVKEATMVGDLTSVVADSFSGCYRVPGLTAASYRMHTSNRFCSVVRCGLEGHNR